MADVRIVGRTIGSIVQVGTWPAEAGTTVAMLETLLGFAPPAPGHAAGLAAATLMGLSPGSWLLVADDAAWPGRLATAFAPGQAAITDLSAARLILRVEGRDVLGLLRQGVGIDLHREAFPPGRCAQTRLHHMNVLLHRPGDDSFDLQVGRSYGHSLHEWLRDAR